MQILIDQIISSFETQHTVCNVPLSVQSPTNNLQICILDPVNIFGRKQPVSVELSDPTGNSNIKILTLKTPMGSKESIGSLLEKYPIYQFPYEQEYFTVKMCLNIEAGADDLHHVYMKVDIPLLEDTGTSNALSQYELNESLKDLIECADLIERLSFSNQDIDLKEVEGEFSSSTYKGAQQLREKLYPEALNQSWHYAFNRKYIFLDKTLPNLAPSLIEAWEYNHKFPFVKFLNLNGELELTLSYYSDDIQMDEQRALESFFIDTQQNLEQQLTVAIRSSPNNPI